jgi:hypothetical protein
VAKPYFEVLFVTPTPFSRYPRTGSRSGSRSAPTDAFVQEAVLVGSFEDAVPTVILNTNLELVVIDDGVTYAVSRDVPLLKNLLSSQCLSYERSCVGRQHPMVAGAVKRFLPELVIVAKAQPHRCTGEMPNGEIP